MGMGERGPGKEALAFKIAKGTDRAADRRSYAAIAPPGLPDKPDWLDGIGPHASACWDERIETLSKTDGLLSPSDGPALAAYCVAWQRFHDAQDRIARDGITCVGEKGGQYQHPAVGIQSKALETISRIGSKFGMTPSDRTSLHIAKPVENGVRRRKPG